MVDDAGVWKIDAEQRPSWMGACKQFGNAAHMGACRVRISYNLLPFKKLIVSNLDQVFLSTCLAAL